MWLSWKATCCDPISDTLLQDMFAMARLISPR
jgi:hypothetical protein